MLKHSLLIVYRSFKRFANTFLINLIGLSTGLACFLLIYLWINDELSFDKFHKNDAQLYQVMANHAKADGIATIDATPDLLAEALAEEIPEVKYAAAAFSFSKLGIANFSLSDNNNNNYKASGQFASKDFFNIFSYKIINGNKSTILLDKSSIAISRQLALKIFGTTKNIVGKALKWQLVNISEPVLISGIFENPPINSSEQFDFLLPFEAWINFSKKIGRPVNWGNNAPSTYLILREGTNIEQFNKKIAGFIKSKNENSKVTLFTRKYSDGYLYGKYENGIQAGGRIEYVKIFSVMAVFILIIACINFMNLSTAKAGSRLKEVGVKKAIGASRKSLAFQFMAESTIMALVSLVVAIVMVELFIPEFNEITGKHITIGYNFNLILTFTSIALVTGILSGSYPALYISRFNPVNILKGKSGSSYRELLARKGLVIFQFTLSIIFIISVLVINKQVQFIQTKNPGFEKENIIYFDKEGKTAESIDNFLTEVKKIPGVVNASVTTSTATGSQSTTGGLYWEGKNPDEIVYFEEMFIGYDMLETLGIKLKEGRTFSKDFGNDKLKIIFNEAAIKAMGLKNPLGKTIRHYTGDKEIIGVAKDFNFESMHEAVKPLLFMIAPEFTTKCLVKIKAGDERQTIERLQNFYEKYNPGFTFDFKFLDTNYQAQYAAEMRINTLSKYFAGLAIIISCLGLFGLTAFSAEKRTKEIGIRKVLGADTKGIVFLLSKDFLNLIIISFAIASPVAWYITKNWLQDFAYRVDINIWIFIIAGVITILISLLTISFQAVKAAIANPVESLKYE